MALWPREGTCVVCALGEECIVVLGSFNQGGGATQIWGKCVCVCVFRVEREKCVVVSHLMIMLGGFHLLANIILFVSH